MKNVMLIGDVRVEREYLESYVKVKSRDWKCKVMIVDYVLSDECEDAYKVTLYSTRKGRRIITLNIPNWYLINCYNVYMKGLV